MGCEEREKNRCWGVARLQAHKIVLSRIKGLSGLGIQGTLQF
jgi:hypothetical protein